MTTATSPNLRKAALLIRSLNAESAAVLLAQLSADEAQAVRDAIRELGDVDPDEQQEICEALKSRSTAHGMDDTMGVELALGAAVAEPSAVAPSATAQPQAERPPFAWLDGGDLPTLASMLEREHLSTVAVVLSHLSPERASEVLAALPPGRRAAALERLADLGESDRASLKVIEQGLADWIASQRAERQRRTDRLRSVQAILQHSSTETCRHVLKEIAGHDRALAAEIGQIESMLTTDETKHKPVAAAPPQAVGGQAASLRHTMADGDQAPPRPRPPQAKPVRAATRPTPPALAQANPSFEFERLTELSRSDLAELFQRCEPDCLVMALAGASEPVTDHVERLLPRHLARELQRRMMRLSAVRLSDFTAAQAQVAETASRLFGARPRNS